MENSEILGFPFEPAKTLQPDSSSGASWEIFSSAYQFVIFKSLSYCFKTIGLYVKTSFASRLVSRLIRWYKPVEITKLFWEKAIQIHGTFHGLKITNWYSELSIFRREKASVDNLCHHMFQLQSNINSEGVLVLTWIKHVRIFKNKRRLYIYLLTILQIFFIKLISEHPNTSRRKAFSRFLWTLYLTLLVLEKLKNSTFEMPMITQTLNMKNLRNISAKSINLHTIRNLVEYSFKIMTAAFFTFE